VWTFNIDPNLIWSDDTPVTADDWVTTFRYGADPKHAWDFAWFFNGVIKNWDESVKGTVPVDQLDLALRASAGLAPFNLSNAESVRMLVPVPQAVWERRLLLHETVAPEFQQTVNEFLLVRARSLGGRQGLRNKQAVLVHAISGTTPEVPDFNDDADALEVETLSPWGPPPAGGGHRSSVNAGVHEHYFTDATEILTVAPGEQLYCWVYLDPDNPPSTLMLQWRTGDFEHRAYWGDNLIALGQDGTASRSRMGDLPTTGEWRRLQVPVPSVGLGNATLNGMKFTLFGGRAAYAATGATNTDGVDREWFDNVLPQGAQQAGDGLRIPTLDAVTDPCIWKLWQKGAVLRSSSPKKTRLSCA